MEHDIPIRSGECLESPVFPEPVRVLMVQPLGESFKIAAVGVRTGQYYERVLFGSQLRDAKIIPAEASFDGDPHRFRLGMEAFRLGLAYEYDPYFCLSIARVDPLPHQLEAVYQYLLPASRIRFLLADDAGAGKTIMAGLLLKELKLRGLVSRTLIVVPANLAFRWQRELQEGFRLVAFVRIAYDRWLTAANLVVREPKGVAAVGEPCLLVGASGPVAARPIGSP